MRMIYPQRDNKRRRKKKLAAVAVCAVGLGIVFGLNYFAPNLFSPIIQTVGKPMMLAGAATNSGLNGVIGFFSSKQSLIQENRNLRDQLALFDAVKLERDVLLQENDELRHIIGGASTTKNITGRILSKPGFSPYDTFIIDVGERDGVKIGDFVLADSTVALGTISVINNHTATVLMYSSPEQRTNIFVGNSAIEAVAVGKGGGNFEIKMPRNAGISEGDVVTLANDPKKIFGSIGKVLTTPSDSFERILFKNSVDVSRIKFVIIEQQYNGRK